LVSEPLLARDRFHCGSIYGQAGNLGKRDRLHRRPQAIITDFSARQSARFGHEFGHREATKTPLASTHAATQERLHLVGAGTPKRRGFENLPRSNFLAAAYQRVAARAAEVRRRLIKAIEKCATALISIERLSCCPFQFSDRKLLLQRTDRRDGGKSPACLGRFCSCDASAIACDGDVRHCSRAVAIHAGHPTQLPLAPSMSDVG